MTVDVGSSIKVRKLKPGGKLDYSWDGVVIHRDYAGIVLRAEFNVEVVEREWATFRRGDIFHEFYYWDAWFNVFQISAPDGALKGWYGNVGMPARLRDGLDELEYVDLALDVWTRPDGEFVILDEDEFEEVVADHPDLADGAQRGREQLIALAKARQLPAWTERP